MKHNTITIIIAISLTLLTYTAGYYKGKAQNIKTIDKMLNELAKNPENPLTEEEFHNLQALLKIKNILTK